MDELKTLIFRTDRIGDFIISCPFILSYKTKYKDNKIVVISSEYNFNYIKNFKFVDKIFPLKNEIKFFKKLFVLIKMIILLRKFNFTEIIVLDGKKRSFFISLFLKGKKSILLQSKGLELLSKIFKYKSVINYELQNQLKNFSFLASKLNFNIDMNKIDIYKNYTFNRTYNLDEKYILIHLDEKWFQKLYYKDFTDINPSIDDLFKLINNIKEINNLSHDIVITTGSKKLDIIDEIIHKFKHVEKNIYEKKFDDVSVKLMVDISFNELEFIVKKSSFLICCEGGVSHASNGFNVKTLAFYQKNRLQHTKYWTGHMENLFLYERKNIKNVISDPQFYKIIQENIQ